MGELVSVIVPVYKVEKTLDRCLESLINQTYKNLEIILVDDGSPDNCGKMCDDWQKRDSRIKVVHKGNGGLGDARNRGLDIATGEYVAFVDSDDTVRQDTYEIAVNSINRDADILIFGMNITDPQGVNPDRSLGFDFELRTNEDWKLNGVKFLDSWYAVVAWNKLYRKAIIDKYSLRFETLRTISEDVVFNYRYFNCCSVIKCIPYPLYNYYFSEGNRINSGNTGYYSRWKKEVQLTTDFAGKKGIGDVMGSLLTERHPSKLFFALMFSLSPNDKISLSQRKRDLKQLYTSGEDDKILKGYLKNRPGVTGKMLYYMYRMRMSRVMIAAIHIFSKINKGK